MHHFLATSFFIIVFLSDIYSQEAADSLNTATHIGIPKLNYKLEDFDFYLDLQSLNKSIILNEDPNTSWLWTAYAMSANNASTNHETTNFNDMTQPLYRKYMSDSKLNSFRYALGMMQAGAVAYLAYKHIKKYGFLKK
ncbi:MAG: hypothetical protein HXY50_11020 [Ignavibacteriaceae bacterium]|nr:hypothetical protein [Ignavibacteriaceae bacterium]